MPRRHTPRKTPRYQSAAQVASCQTKRRFPTEKQARDAAETQMLMDMQLELDVYQCPYCGSWHLTSRNKHP